MMNMLMLELLMYIPIDFFLLFWKFLEFVLRHLRCSPGGLIGLKLLFIFENHPT